MSQIAVASTGGSSPADLVDQLQSFYVAKSGDDGNTGLNIDQAFLTFGAAMAAATAETPSATNLFVIICSDAGIYTENITCVRYVSIDAPNATIEGSITLDRDMYVNVGHIAPPSGDALIKSSAGTVSVDVEEITINASQSAVLVSAGVLCGYISQITWLGGGSSIGIEVTGGTADLHVGLMGNMAEGYNVSAGILRLFCGNLAQTVAQTGGTVEIISPDGVRGVTIYNPTITDYTETLNTVAASGATETIDLSLGTIQKITLNDNCAITFPANTAGKSFLLMLAQDVVGSRTVTWDADVKWPNNTAPTLTATPSKVDIFSFVCDGTNWFGAIGGQNYL